MCQKPTQALGEAAFLQQSGRTWRRRCRFPSEYQVTASHWSLLTREEGGEGGGHKTNTKRHAARSESKQCRDCNLFLGRKWGCCVFKRGCWSLIAAAGVCACACVCEREIEDSGDSLLKQYNGHLSPRGVIQIQYQARTFSTPHSASRRTAAAFIVGGGRREEAGTHPSIHPSIQAAQRASQSVPETRRGRVDGRRGASLPPFFWSPSAVARWGAFTRSRERAARRGELKDAAHSGN